MELSAAQKLFLRECDFRAGAANMESMPPIELPEVAFAGRSNVGKSSLINALLTRKSLARVSQSPGCTAQINFYNLFGRMMLVDLPGYGYARKSKSVLKEWDGLIKSYLQGRPNLKRVCILIDCRRGIKEMDEEIMKLMDEAAVVYQIVFTKADEVNASEIAALSAQAQSIMSKHQALHPVPFFTSSEKKTGLEELREEIAVFAAPADA